MRFAADEWLWGVLFSLCLAGILILQGLRLSRARARFGDEAQIRELLTARTGMRRAIRGVLSCLAVALAFVAAAQPQFGKGTRVLPATNLDVVLVLDYSKSMYARDVSPSRIGRAKVEVGKLIRELGGARFAAVAFAGESISFPLTSDGSAIAQFFRGMSPNDLPVGGTAIARALESGQQLLERDPLSKNHERVMILVTDGEDLEGDPVAVAEALAAAGIRVDVVQIGGQSPEPIPQIDENGVAQGLRKDENGALLTTQLTAEGEAQLQGIARAGGGQLVRAAQGDVGIHDMTVALRKLMSEELSERVETVFADIYHYPLALALVLLIIEAWIGAAPKRTVRVEPPKGRIKKRKPRRLQTTAALLALLSLGCEHVDPLFERESPVVNDAISALKQNDPERASKLLIEYLETGPCEAGVIGAGDRARGLRDASFDLALSFSALSRRANEKAPSDPAADLSQGKLPPGALPPGAAPTPPQGAAGAPEGAAPAPGSQFIDCGLRILATVSGNNDASAELRARAHYLSGNFEMLREKYADAVTAYDQALLFAPGVAKSRLNEEPFKSLALDPFGESIAWNRALALRLQKEQEKKEQEEKDKEKEQQDPSEEPNEDEKSEKDKSDDEGKQDEEKQNEEKQDEKSKEEEEKGDQEGKDDKEPKDEPGDQGDEKEPGKEQAESDKGEQEPPEGDQEQPSPEEAQQAANPSEARDQRMLDLLEQAPTLQQHNAEQRSKQGGRVRATMEDK